MYNLHGTEQDFSNTFNPNNIDPNEIFKMFFNQAGGDPFANLFNGGGGGTFRVYTNIGGGPMFRQGGGRGGGNRQQTHQHPGFQNNIFDLFNQMNEPGPTQRRRAQQQYQEERPAENDVFNIFEQQRSQRGRNNREHQNAKTPGEVILINLLNQCLP